MKGVPKWSNFLKGQIPNCYGEHHWQATRSSDIQRATFFAWALPTRNPNRPVLILDFRGGPVNTGVALGLRGEDSIHGICVSEQGKLPLNVYEGGMCFSGLG
jgi:hypothetical protein